MAVVLIVLIVITWCFAVVNFILSIYGNWCQFSHGDEPETPVATMFGVRGLDNGPWGTGVMAHELTHMLTLAPHLKAFLYSFTYVILLTYVGTWWSVLWLVPVTIGIFILFNWVNEFVADMVGWAVQGREYWDDVRKAHQLNPGTKWQCLTAYPPYRLRYVVKPSVTVEMPAALLASVADRVVSQKIGALP